MSDPVSRWNKEASQLPPTVAATATRTAVTSIPVKFLASRFAVAAGMMIKAPMRSTPKKRRPSAIVSANICR